MTSFWVGAPVSISLPVNQPKKKEKLDIDGLNDYRLLKLEYAIKTENKFAALNDEGEENNTPLDIENSWTSMKEILLTTAEEVLGKKKKTKNTPWMTDEILELIAERRKFKRNEPEHKKRHKEIQKRCRKEKEKWLNDKCEEVEYLRKKHQDRDMHKKLKEVTYYKNQISLEV